MTRPVEDYWTSVEAVAEAIVAEFNDADAEDRNELLTRLVHEHTDQHDYVIGTNVQIHTLQFSNHPCASFFNGTCKADYSAHDEFPFAAFAADAFEADVRDKVLELLD